MAEPLNPEGFVSRSDPYAISRQRHGRKIRCPHCMASFETMRRFEMTCPECGYEWEEPSHRTVIDWLLELPAKLAGDLFLVLPAVCLIVWVGLVGLVIEEHGDGLARSLELGALLAALLVGTVVLARRMNVLR